jgi:hypothetical protein
LNYLISRALESPIFFGLKNYTDPDLVKSPIQEQKYPFQKYPKRWFPLVHHPFEVESDGGEHHIDPLPDNPLVVIAA